jgi:DNA-directed RNA polymerase specialized sigma24 family protein
LRVGWTGDTDDGDPDWIEPGAAGQPESGAPGAAEADRGPGTGAAGSDEALVRAVLDEMTAADQEVLRLAFGPGFGAAEIAVTLGTSIRRAQADLQSVTARFEARGRLLSPSPATPGSTAGR